MDLNRATVLGRLTRDPEVRTTPSGKTVANIGVATGRVWTDQAGAKQEKTEFHNCVLWGKIGEIAGQYLSKGRKVYVEGRLETRDWTGKDGVKRYRTEIIVDNLIMLDGPRGGGQGSANAGMPPMPSENSSPSSEPEEEEIKVEDIPF
ncbi:MAG: single-stranded DNA-binding protein [Candidatus Magasanikbacteria bacterium]